MIKASKHIYLSGLLVLCCLCSLQAQVTKDTSVTRSDTTIAPVTVKDTATAKKVDSTVSVHSPRKAAIRSAIIPGWGQIYNRRYWKLPLVYGALGTTAGVFVYNLKTYRDLRFAFRAMAEAADGDSSNYDRMKPQYKNYDAESIRYYRNEFRKNVDYSVLVFIIFWGLQVADAAVDAHLKTFDVSPDLSFKIKGGYSELGNTHGLSLVLAFK